MSFDAANPFETAVALWTADLDRLNEDLCEKNALEARIDDLYRNNDLMRALVDKDVDAEIGSSVKLQARPDWEGLGVTKQEASDWSKKVENEFHAWADSPENWITADRSMNFTQLCRSGTRMRRMAGETFASREWRGSPLGIKTCFQLVSPHRIKNPSGNRNLNRVFHGIELDRYGAAMAYHVQTAKGDQKRSFGNKTTKRVPKYNQGWLQMCHIWEPMKPEYPRGISPYSAILVMMKQRERAGRAILDKEIIAATYALAITSNEDPESVASMLAGGDSKSSGMKLATEDEEDVGFAAQRDEILETIRNSRLQQIAGSQWLHLFDGESAQVLQSSQQSQTTEEFLKGYSKMILSGAGMSYELASGDFKGVNFSAANMSLGIFEYSVNIRRRVYGHRLPQFCYRAFLDEMILRERIPLLGGVDYWAKGAKEKYARCSFTGVRQIHADPFKTARTNNLKLTNGTGARSQFVNENGDDFDDLMTARSDDAVRLLQAVRTAAQCVGVELNPAEEKKILIDAVATAKVDVGDVETTVEVE